MRFRIWPSFLLTLIFNQAGVLGSNLDNDIAGGRSPNESLYECRFTYFPLPASWTRIILQHMVPLVTSKELDEDGEQEVVFGQRLSYDSATSEVDLSTIDPNLPFTFFIHGFNQNSDTINNTYMDQLTTVFEHYYKKTASMRQKSTTNVVYVKWYVKSLFADTLFSRVPVYYKTMANYQIILDYVVKAIVKLIDQVEEARGGWESCEARSRYFAQFRFYGHSLGAHIIAHAVGRIHQLRPHVRFGKLVGLDPAHPCFYNGDLGINADKVANSTNQVIVVHTNLGFTGVDTPRSPIEIVLNGGTFQPNCPWYDWGCSHVRATDILSYFDDQCQMVAYRCSKHEQFKLGACETCEQAYSDTPGDDGCILVNLTEQHVDSEESLPNDDEDGPRQLADEDDDSDNTLNDRTLKANNETLQADQARLRKASYHFVNTNPKGGVGSTSHCLQHYQMRLLILNGSPAWRQKCPMSNFLVAGSNKIKLQLFFEPSSRLLRQRNRLGLLSSSRQAFGSQELQAILTDELHTGLLNYEGKPELFVGAVLSNVNFDGWAKCLTKLRDSDKIEVQFVLDMAFMSHVKKRHMYSSVLCGLWNPRAYQNDDNGFMLNLCKQSELTQVSGKIDELLRQVRFEHQYESWQISLLNSLFSLYVEWDPLR